MWKIVGRNALQFHFLGRSQFKALLVTFLVIVTDSPVSVQQLRTSSAETAHPSCDIDGHSSSSHMRVVNHNWSATKQRLHPQSVAEISRHSVLSVDRIRQRETSISFCGHRSVPVPCENGSADTTVFRGRSKRGCRIVGSHTRWELTTWADFQLCLHRRPQWRQLFGSVSRPLLLWLACAVYVTSFNLSISYVHIYISCYLTSFVWEFLRACLK